MKQTINNKKLLLATASALIMQMTMSLNVNAQNDTDDNEGSISYSFIELNYVHDNLNANGLVISDRDGQGNTADDNFGTLSAATGKGGSIRGSYTVAKTDTFGIHFAADYVTSNHDAGISVADINGAQIAAGLLDSKQTEFRFAIGSHTMMSEIFSVFIELGLVSNQITFGNATLTLLDNSTASPSLKSASGSRTALDGRLGFRARAGEKIEFTGYARYHGNGALKTADDGSTATFTGKVRGGAGAMYHFNDHIALKLDYQFGKPGRVQLGARLTF